MLHCAELAEAGATPPATVAIAWCLRNPHVSSVILGATSALELVGTMTSRLQKPVWLNALRQHGVAWAARIAKACRYAQELCLEEEPPLVPADDPGHLYACHFPVGTEAGRQALARNEAEGRTPAQDETEVSIVQPAGSGA